jgi:iron complex transport system permease protein
VGLLLSFSWLGVQSMAFLFGLVAVSCTLSITAMFRAGSLTLIVLAGLVVSSCFEALISLAKYVADPIDKLPSITFWLMGSLGKAGPADVALAAIPIAVAFAILYLMRWQINVLALGDEEALALGVNATQVRIAVIAASTLLTAPAIAICGIIGWVGLLIPHIGRMLAGPNFPNLLLVSLVLGAGYLLLVDDIVRALRVEIPLGILTAIVGAPFFVFLLTRLRKGWT